MSKRRRTSSPYPHPPSEFVREVMRASWRRCDAEALAMVAFCLERAAEAKVFGGLDLLAAHAAAALETEPVLAAAALRLAPRRDLWPAFNLLLGAAPFGRRAGLFRLREVAVMYEIAAEDEDEFADWSA